MSRFEGGFITANNVGEEWEANTATGSLPGMWRLTDIAERAGNTIFYLGKWPVIPFSPAGEVMYDTPGTYTYVTTSSVISAVAVGGGHPGGSRSYGGGGGGLGWIGTTPLDVGTSLTVFVGAAGQTSYIKVDSTSELLVSGNNGSGTTGGTYFGDGGGNGGNGAGGQTGGGGGAGGYYGPGGPATSSNIPGGGGGGGNPASGTFPYSGCGGGVGIWGAGAGGAVGPPTVVNSPSSYVSGGTGFGGSGGIPLASSPVRTPYADSSGYYGGGGGSGFYLVGGGGKGAVRIVFGQQGQIRAYPNTETANLA